MKNKFYIFIIAFFLIFQLLGNVSSTIQEIGNINVLPLWGVGNETFCFMGEYWDSDNDAPDYFRVYIKDTYYDCQKWDISDVDYTNGCGYFKYIQLDTGIFMYYFETKSGSDIVISNTYYLEVLPQYIPTEYEYPEVNYNLIIFFGMIIFLLIIAFVFYKKTEGD